MTQYVLGSSDAEVRRLDLQAANIAGPTDGLLRASGIRPGMRVLDLGTGLGHVAFQLAELVGPEGSVVGVDREAPLLAVAESRRVYDTVRFVEADVRTVTFDEPFDAIVCRLLLFHLPDAIGVLRHQQANLRPGGMIVAVDFDLGGCRTEPDVPLATECLRWVEAAFRSAQAEPRIGARLALLLGAAGLSDVTTFGVQGYLAPTDPSGPTLIAGVVRSLAQPILENGIATAEQLDLDTLQDRLTAEVTARDAVVLPPTVAGAWGRLRS
jgi:SAM-dependent methyltransferase